MKQLVRIALLHASKRRFRQRRLNVHHRLRVSFRERRQITQQFEHMLHVLYIFLAGLIGFRVGLGVVIAVGKAQPAGVGKCNDTAGVRKILIRSKSEQHAVARDFQMLPSQVRRQIAQRMQSCDRRKLRLDRRKPSFLHSRLIHASGKVIADLGFYYIPVARSAWTLLPESPTETARCPR